MRAYKMFNSGFLTVCKHMVFYNFKTSLYKQLIIGKYNSNQIKLGQKSRLTHTY